MLNNKMKFAAAIVLSIFTAGTLTSCAGEEKKTDSNSSQSAMTTTQAAAQDTPKRKVIDTNAVSRPIKAGNQSEPPAPAP